MSAPASSVFITGMSGFMGRALAERCRAAGARVWGVDREADPSNEVIAGDTSREGEWQRAMEGAELVVHTAAIVSFRGDDQRFWEVNVKGTRNALDAAVRAKAKRFVHVSSIAAFGFEFPENVDERWPVRTNGSPYVDTKIAGEQVVLAAHASGEIPCTIIRPGDVYGPRSRPWTILPIEMMSQGRMLLPEGGNGKMAPVYIDNLVDGLVLAAEVPEAAGQVFTITDGVVVSTSDFFGRYAKLLGVRPPPVLPTRLLVGIAGVVGPIERLFNPSSEVDPKSAHYLARRGTYSIDKARRMLGYAPKIDLEEGFARTAAWLRAEGRIH